MAGGVYMQTGVSRCAMASIVERDVTTFFRVGFYVQPVAVRLVPPGVTTASHVLRNTPVHRITCIHINLYSAKIVKKRLWGVIW